MRRSFMKRDGICRNLLAAFAALACFHLAAQEKSRDVRWEASFKETYSCKATGRDVAFAVRTPPKIEGREKYPLVVVLKGGPRVNPSADLPFFEIKPAGGGIWGYRSMSAVDAMQAIAFMKRNYPIDPDRISLAGSSAGGSGAMHLASLHPHEFSCVVPLVAAGNDYPLTSFQNLPVAFHHGDRDWTSAICDARVQFQKMKAAGCPVILQEYPGAGHSIPRPHEPITKWMLEQERHPVQPDPKPIDFLEGAAWNLYRGDPMIVVYGTGGGHPERLKHLRAAAEKLARCGGPHSGFMNHTRFPVVADSDLTPEQEATANLLLVGAEEENSVAKRMLSKWPVGFEIGHLTAGDRQRLPMRDQVLSLGLTHPEHPDRFVYLVAPHLEDLSGFAA
ncbi:MAG: hypothetical protein HKN23_07415, partial [Verrucomicrobiales bacterium]|nr:hypothetical protein [Verrucomicrobiales bacterium]